MLYFIILYLFNLQLFENSINSESEKIIGNENVNFSQKLNIIKNLANNKNFKIIEQILDKYESERYEILFNMKLIDYQNDVNYNKLLDKYTKLYENDNRKFCSVFETFIDVNSEYGNIFIDEFKTLIIKYNINFEVEMIKNKKYNCAFKLLREAVMNDNELITDLLLKHIKNVPEDFAFFVARNHKMSITMAFILERHKIKVDNSIDNNKNTIMDYLYEDKEDKDIYITILYLKSKGIKKACKVLNKSCIDLSNRLIFVSKFMLLSDGATEIYENF